MVSEDAAPASRWPLGLEQEPPPGAHLTCSRRGYSHHRVYIGRGRVVHYSGLSGGFWQCGPVEEVSLSRFALGHAVRIVEHPESPWSHRPSPQRGDPSVDEHHQCRALQAPDPSARTSRTALRGCAGVWATRYGRGGQAVHRLFIVAAGDPAAVGACRPLFDALGQKTFPIGPDPAAANLVKLSGNFLLASAEPALMSLR
jgi:hypothetical protein